MELKQQTARDFLMLWCADARNVLAAATPMPWKKACGNWIEADARGYVAGNIGESSDVHLILLSANSLLALTVFAEKLVKLKAPMSIVQRAALVNLAKDLGWKR